MSPYCQIHNHRDPVHNVVGFASTCRYHELVDRRYKIYISQIAINLPFNEDFVFPLSST